MHTSDNAVALLLALERVGPAAGRGVAPERHHRNRPVLRADRRAGLQQLRRQAGSAADCVRQRHQAAPAELHGSTEHILTSIARIVQQSLQHHRSVLRAV